MPLFGGKSGFKSARDLLTYLLGVGLLIWHVTVTDPAKWNKEFIIFCGALLGMPYVLGKDEKRREEDKAVTGAVRRERQIAKKTTSRGN